MIFISGAVSSQNYTITANKSSFAFGENANFTLSVSPTTLPANISVIWYSQNQSSVIGTGTNLQLNINNLKKDTIFYCRFEGCESNWTGFIPINININKIENYNVVENKFYGTLWNSNWGINNITAYKIVNKNSTGNAGFIAESGSKNIFLSIDGAMLNDLLIRGDFIANNDALFWSGIIFKNIPTFNDNSTAKAVLQVGQIFRTTAGDLKIVY